MLSSLLSQCLFLLLFTKLSGRVFDWYVNIAYSRLNPPTVEREGRGTEDRKEEEERGKVDK